MSNKIINEFKSIIYQEMDESHGNWSTSEYRNMIFNIILLVYLSNKFKLRYLELVKEDLGFEGDPDEYILENIFFLRPESRWDNVLENIQKEDSREVFDYAIKCLKHDNPSLKEVILPVSMFEIEEFALNRFLYIFKDFISENTFRNELWVNIYKSFLIDFISFNDEWHDKYEFQYFKIELVV